MRWAEALFAGGVAMHYAISFKDQSGCPQRSEVSWFADDRAALNYGRLRSHEGGIVEVWRESAEPPAATLAAEQTP